MLSVSRSLGLRLLRLPVSGRAKINQFPISTASTSSQAHLRRLIFWNLRSFLRLCRPHFHRQHRGHRSGARLLLGAVGTCFSWSQAGIPEEEMDRIGSLGPEPSEWVWSDEKDDRKQHPWELILVTSAFKMWQRPVAGREAEGQTVCLFHLFLIGSISHRSHGVLLLWRL